MTGIGFPQEAVPTLLRNDRSPLANWPYKLISMWTTKVLIWQQQVYKVHRLYIVLSRKRVKFLQSQNARRWARLEEMRCAFSSLHVSQIATSSFSNYVCNYISVLCTAHHQLFLSIKMGGDCCAVAFYLGVVSPSQTQNSLPGRCYKSILRWAFGSCQQAVALSFHKG